MVAHQTVTKDTVIGDVVQKHPEAIEVFLNHGLHCIGCHVSFFETVEQGAMAHGMTKKQLNEMLKEANKAIKKNQKKDPLKKQRFFLSPFPFPRNNKILKFLILNIKKQKSSAERKPVKRPKKPT